MFTGLIEEIGTIHSIEAHGDAARITVNATRALEHVALGDSIAVSGVCLTVISFNNSSFTVDVMGQTLDMSTLSAARPGTRVNLERAARLGDRLGGHIVQGHVDDTAHVLSRDERDDWRVLRFAIGEHVAALLVDKGSVTLDGVSLTVSNLSEAHAEQHWFEVSLIPETLKATTLGELVPGDTVNIETDILARHILRAAQFTPPAPKGTR